MIQISPSILAADFSRLGEEVRAIDQAGAHRVHIDVMDGHFVPNLSMGPEIVKCLRPITKLDLEVHLMIEQPDRYVDAFIKAGADILIVHQEVLEDPQLVIAKVRGAGKRIGLAINPDKPVERLAPHLAQIDLVLCMTVFPGFAGQSFVAESPGRIQKLRQMIDGINKKCDLEVDGGIDEETAVTSVKAGANVLAMASALFRAPEGAGAALKRIVAKIGSL